MDSGNPPVPNKHLAAGTFISKIDYAIIYASLYFIDMVGVILQLQIDQAKGRTWTNELGIPKNRGRMMVKITSQRVSE